MTRIPRSRRPGRDQQELAVPTRRYLPGGVIELRPIRHLRCPCCGLMARLEATESKSGERYGIEGGPYFPSAAEQRYGGSPPKGSPEVNRNDKEYNRGRIQWTKDIPISNEELETLKTVLASALETVEEQLGR